MNYDVIVLGAGAAGLMCAIETGKRGRRVLIIEHQTQIGRKILISGGGRCNFTNIHTTPENFLSANPQFCRSALARYRPENFIALIERHQIEYYEKTLGQLFCRRSAREITAMLQRECDACGVEIALATKLSHVTFEDGFLLSTSKGDFHASALVVATGGLSIPQIGASGLAYDLARQFGHSIVEPYPALVPLTWQPADLQRFSKLSGISFRGVVQIGDRRFEEKCLFTHRGLSGPAILQISSYWEKGLSIEIDLLPDLNLEQEFRARRSAGEKAEAKTILVRKLPQRLIESWSALPGLTQPVAQLSDSQIRTISENLHHWHVTPEGTEGFGKAEVTGGGIDTREISSKTFESSKVSGLYFIGEALDVTGHLGGYNFQWAWASGHACGQVV